MRSSFALVDLGNGLHTLRDLQTGETFHPGVGPMAEAEAIHLRPLDLESRLQPESRVTIWDVGLGAAANAIALIEKIRYIPRSFDCEMISFDLTLDPLLFALENAVALEYPMRWREVLRELVEAGETSIRFPEGGTLLWRLALGDFTQFPAANIPDGVIYDPYSPRKNEAMWSLRHFTELRKRLSRPALLTSYSRSTAVRVTLLLAGFYVGVGSPTGEKDQTTLAATSLDLLAEPLGETWLARVRLSTSSRPIGEGGIGPIQPEDLEKLEKHPQFV